MKTRILTMYLQHHATVAVPLLAIAAALLFLLATNTVSAADEPTLTEKTKQTVQETSGAVKEAGQTAAEDLKTLWQRVDENRLKNRTRDEIVAWIFMGVLVGSVAGMMTSLKPSGLGKLGRLLLGLAGAFLGGMVVRVAQVNFGWGPVLIRYEELVFSLVGAIVIVGVGKIVLARSKKKVPAK